MKSKIRLNQLIIKGEEYQRTFSLSNSLIIIKGDGYAGKSLLLKLIVYCLGGKADLIDLSVQKELCDTCDEVFLEFVIGTQIYTVQRNLKMGRDILKIYLCPFEEYTDFSPWKKDVDEANTYFANELQIPLHRILKRKAGSKDLTEERISFRDVMRYVFIDQGELGTIHFMNNSNTFVSRKNKEVFKIINDLIIPDLQEINEKIQIVQNDMNEYEKVKDGLENYLENKDAQTLVQLVDTREDYRKQIEQLTTEKNGLIRNKKNKTSDIYLKLNNDIETLDSDLVRVEQESSRIKLSILNKESLLEDYREEGRQLSATLEAMKKIRISEHSERCPLCNSVVEIKQENESSEDIELAIRQIEDKRKTLMELLEQDKKLINDKILDIKKTEDKKQVYLNALGEYKKNLEIPYLSEIESYNSLIKDITDEKNKINSLIDIHHDKESHEMDIKKLKNELEVLTKKKEDLQSLQQREKGILKRLNKRFRELMKRFNFQDTYEDLCYISEENYLPYYDGISVLKHSSGCLLLCMEIAYLGAILELNKEEDANCHPGLFMIDTVSNNIGTDSDSEDSIDPETYNEIFRYIAEISSDNQVLIVDNTPPQIDTPHTEFIFRRVKKGEKLKGFISTESNEFCKKEVDIKTETLN